MLCKQFKYADHAIFQMDARNISVDEVEIVLSIGEKIADYPTDKPYPSCLILGFVQARPIHVVVAQNKVNNDCIIITTYEPNAKLWSLDFKTKIK